MFKKSAPITLDHPLVHTFIVHSALLVVMLLAISPMAALSCVSKGLISSPEIMNKAYLSELKNLTPFWFAGLLFLTTRPDTETALILFRMFTAARMILILSYATRPMPSPCTDIAHIISYTITSYMAMCAVCHYRTAI